MNGAPLSWLGIVRLGLVQTSLGAVVVLVLVQTAQSGHIIGTRSDTRTGERDAERRRSF